MIGAIGEVAGAAAVVVTLFYLARQIREGARQDRRMQYAQLNRDFLQLPGAIAHDESFSNVFYQGMVDPSSLSQAQRARFYSAVLITFRSLEALFHYHREGGVDDWGAASHQAAMVDLLGMPGFRCYWADRKHWYSAEFQKEVELWLSRAPESPLLPRQEDEGGAGASPEARMAPSGRHGSAGLPRT